MNCPRCNKTLRVYGLAEIAIEGYFEPEPSGMFDEILMVDESIDNLDIPTLFSLYCKECHGGIPPKLVKVWEWKMVPMTKY